MTETLSKCAVCHDDGFQTVQSDYDGAHIRCDLCGEYKVSGSVLEKVLSLDEDGRQKIFQWITSQTLHGGVPEITSYNLKRILGVEALPFSERRERMLIALDRKTTQPGLRIDIDDVLLRRASGLIHGESYNYLINHLKNAGYIERFTDNRMYLTPEGFERIEKIRLAGKDSAQGFVAMWFTAELDDAWSDGFERAISGAGYLPMRVDQKEHVNKICDEIISEIRRSKFVVVDYTGHRGGVYYEAGFAHGLGIPVINTCRKDHMGDLHFDIRQYNCIDWSDPEELRNRLQLRIESIIGDGPYKATS